MASSPPPGKTCIFLYVLLHLALFLVAAPVAGGEYSSHADLVHLPLVVRSEATGPILWGDVVHIVDGDTFDVSLPCCPCVPVFRVRPLGVDTAEPGQCYAQEATDALEAMILGRRVGLETDHTDHDMYGRWLRWVWSDGELVNAQLVAQGYAVVDIIGPDDRHAARLYALEAEAQAARRGGWGACGW